MVLWNSCDMRGPRGPKRCGGRPLASSRAIGTKTARFREQLYKRSNWRNSLSLYTSSYSIKNQGYVYIYLQNIVTWMVNCSRTWLEIWEGGLIYLEAFPFQSHQTHSLQRWSCPLLQQLNLRLDTETVFKKIHSESWTVKKEISLSSWWPNFF